MIFDIKQCYFIKKLLLSVILVSVILIFYGCSDENKDAKKVDNKQEVYNFESSKQDFLVEIKNVDNNIQIPIIDKKSGKNILEDNNVKIIAIFPINCNMCMPTLIHLSNLAARTKELKVIVLSQTELNNKLYKDFLPPSSPKFQDFISADKNFPFFIDSLKRNLNIEIKDFKSPLFLLIDNTNNVTRSYEGAILEEIFESDVNDILSISKKQDSNQETNKEQ